MTTISTRTATPADLDAIVEIHLRAMPGDPGWDYCLRYRCQFPYQTETFVRGIYEKYFNNVKGRYHVMVAETPITDDGMRKPIAVAVWTTNTTIDDDSPIPDHSLIGDVQRIRLQAEVMDDVQEHCFDKFYGDTRIHLEDLYTHPKYQLRGAGGKLVKWGISQAKAQNKAVTLFASPMGKSLYAKLGFKDLDTTSAQVEGEDEKLSIAVMAYVPETGLVRTATLSDLSDIVSVVLAAMPTDPAWGYRYRYQSQYPHETYKFTMLHYSSLLGSKSDEYHVIIAEVPSIGDEKVMKIVGVCEWRTKETSIEAGIRSRNTAAKRPDTDSARYEAWLSAQERAEERHFGHLNDQRFHLSILGVHPAYQRRGIGENLLQKGLKSAREQDLAVTAFGSPMGKRLYRRMGFRELEMLTVRVDGEEEGIKMAVMDYRHPRMLSN